MKGIAGALCVMESAVPLLRMGRQTASAAAEALKHSIGGDRSKLEGKLLGYSSLGPPLTLPPSACARPRLASRAPLSTASVLDGAALENKQLTHTTPSSGLEPASLIVLCRRARPEFGSSCRLQLVVLGLRTSNSPLFQPSSFISSHPPSPPGILPHFQASARAFRNPPSLPAFLPHFQPSSCTSRHLPPLPVILSYFQPCPSRALTGKPALPEPPP